MELRSLIGAARKKDTPVRKAGVAFEGNGQRKFLNLSVTPLGEKGQDKQQSENGSYLVLPLSFRSVPKICTWKLAALSPKNSSSVMASE